MQYQCHLCQKGFTRESSLRYHLEHKVCERVYRFVCLTCGKQFMTKKGLTYHQNKQVCHRTTTQAQGDTATATVAKTCVTIVNGGSITSKN